MIRAFISYSRPDEDYARSLYNSLREEGFDPWFDKESLLPGQDWEIEIRKAISQSDFVVLLLSRNSVDRRGYFQKEMRVALNILQTVPIGHIYLLPARINECEVPDILAPIQWVDLFPDWNAGFKKLLKAIGRQVSLQPKSSLSDKGEPMKLEATEEDGKPIAFGHFTIVTRDHVESLLKGVDKAIRERAELALLSLEVSFENREVLSLLGEPDSYDWIKHLYSKIHLAGLRLLSRSTETAPQWKMPSSAHLASYLLELANTHQWTQVDAALELDATLPESIPVVVNELLELNSLTGGDIARWPAWYIQVYLSKLMIPYPSPLILNTLGTIIRMEKVSVRSALVSHLIRHAQSMLPESKLFEAWFESIAGKTFAMYKQEEERMMEESRELAQKDVMKR